MLTIFSIGVTSSKEIAYEIERAPIKIESTDYSLIKEHNTGYLRIKTFGSDTTPDVKKALEYFKSKQVSRLIIDLRFNPGGLLNAAVDQSYQMVLSKRKADPI